MTEGESVKKWILPQTRCLEEYLVKKDNVHRKKEPPKGRGTDKVVENRTVVQTVVVERRKKGKRREGEKKQTDLKKRIEAFRDNGIDEPCSSEEGLRRNEYEETVVDRAVFTLLHTLKGIQDRKWKTSQEKARAHRRLVCGAHETLKHLRAGNVHSVYVARNMDREMTEESVTTLLIDIDLECLKHAVPLVRGLSKKKMSKAVNKHPYTNVVGVLNVDGVKHLFTAVEDALNIIMDNSNMSLCYPDQPTLFA